LHVNKKDSEAAVRTFQTRSLLCGVLISCTFTEAVKFVIVLAVFTKTHIIIIIIIIIIVIVVVAVASCSCHTQ
jgi:hypothetical protein